MRNHNTHPFNPHLKHLLVVASWAFVFLIGVSVLPSTGNTSWLSLIQVHASQQRASTAQTSSANQTYLPITFNAYPWLSRFGIQSGVPLTSGPILDRALELNTGWVRLGGISWRQLQPNEGDPIGVDELSGFEDQIRALNQYGIRPEVVVSDSPRWATINNPYPTSCGAIRADKFLAFAQFMRQLVTRYKTAAFNIHAWELGNEIDVDPGIVNPDNGYGCWGDVSDPFYGGRQYGEMLKVVGPAIKEADPTAQVWSGGLLLNSPNTTAAGAGKPEQFLRGVLEAGAAPFFDVVPYHTYPAYFNMIVDYEDPPGGTWESWGGVIVGKARFLRQIMSDYNVSKPLFLNETSLLCGDAPQYDAYCQLPDDTFYRMQADYLVRGFVRGLAERIEGFIWFTIDGPGWLHSGLLTSDEQPQPAFVAYQTLSEQLQHATYIGPAQYTDGTEAYSFYQDGERVDVVWAKTDETIEVYVPQADLVTLKDRDGTPLPAFLRDGAYQLSVGFDPIYIIRKL